MTPPPRHLTLTQRKPPPSFSSYTGSEDDDSSAGSPQPPDVPECDVPIPSIERTADWVFHSGGNRANSRADSPPPPPGDSGTPALSETSVPARASSVSRGRSLSDNHGNSRSPPSASPILAASNFDGEPEIKREASEHSFWSASPRPLGEPAPLPAPSRSGSRVLYPASAGSKRSRDAEDVGAGERSPQRRRTASTGLLEPAVTPSDPELVVVAPAEPAVDAAVTTDRAGSVNVVAVTALPVILAVVAVVNIVDIEPAAGLADVAAPVAAVANPVARPAVVAVANPGPLPDRAEVRLQARLDALLAQSRDLPRAQRSAMVISSPNNLKSSFLTDSFTAKIAGIVALTRRATPGLPGSGARLRIPRRRVKVRCPFLRLPWLELASGRSSDVVSPLRSPSWARALARCLRPRSSQSSDARFRFCSTSALLFFASTADVPCCHHFARLFSRRRRGFHEGSAMIRDLFMLFCFLFLHFCEYTRSVGGVLDGTLCHFVSACSSALP